MKSYVAWSLRQFYLLFFWPTQFRREVSPDRPEGPRPGHWPRFRYLLAMLPWLTALAALGYFLASHLKATQAAVLAARTNDVRRFCEALGIDFFPSERTWDWVGLGVVGVGCVMFGAALGAALGVVLGVAHNAANAARAHRGEKGLAATVRQIFIMGASTALDLALGVGLLQALGIGFAFVFEQYSWSSSLTAVESAAVCGLVVGTATGVAYGAAYGPWLGMTLGALACLWPVTLVALAYLLRGEVVASVGVYSAAVALMFSVSYFRFVTYPFDVALAGACYFTGRRRPRALPRVWKRCPVAWNEVIWLPLPFVSGLLALLVKENQVEGLRQIAFVASERRLQRRAALAALAEVTIGDLEAESVKELAAVTDKLRWTTDAPVELPAGLDAAVPRFDRVAQQVGQYLTLHSPYRQGETLDRALAELEALQRSLVAAPGREAPRLLRVANDWRGVLEAEREALRARVKPAREIENPFLVGMPVTEQDANVFTGRQDIVRQIEGSVVGTTRPPTLLLHGPRRMGKTSVLYQLPRLLGPDFAPALIDCQDPAVRSSPAELLGFASRALREGLQRQRVEVRPPSTEALERAPYPAFRGWLEEMERQMPPGMRALLCLDEYDRLPAIQGAAWVTDFLDFLRHLIQHHPRVVVLFTGAHTFEEQGPAWTDRFLNARRMRVSFLRREDVIPLLTRPIPTFDMTYAPGALEAVLSATNGQPYLTQAVAFELVQFLNEQQRKEATPADVEAAITRALVAGGEYFANVWYDAGEEGQAVLAALARGEAPPDHPRARAWLREHDVLDDAGGFAVPMVERWVRSKVGVS
jgi:hypothetical protein